MLRLLRVIDIEQAKLQAGCWRLLIRLISDGINGLSKSRLRCADEGQCGRNNWCRSVPMPMRST